MRLGSILFPQIKNEINLGFGLMVNYLSELLQKWPPEVLYKKGARKNNF